mgnify:CR=1 FL=1
MDKNTSERLFKYPITEMAPEEVYYDGEHYKWINGGGSGKIYINETKKFILKIIMVLGDGVKNIEKEIYYQNIAASQNLAPKIHMHTYYIHEQNGKKYTIGIIKMDYLGKRILGRESVSVDKEICEFINKFVDLGIVNLVDPIWHFYKEGGRIKMIDYGFVEKIDANATYEYKIELKNQMAEKANVQCDFSVGGGAANRGGARTNRRQTKRRTKRRQTKRRRTKRRQQNKRRKKR